VWTFVGLCCIVGASESFDASCLGEAEKVVEKRVADDAMVSSASNWLTGQPGVGCVVELGRAATLLLRGANDMHLDEMRMHCKKHLS
jgi:chaperonin GroEL (HSP60 family)